MTTTTYLILAGVALLFVVIFQIAKEPRRRLKRGRVRSRIMRFGPDRKAGPRQLRREQLQHPLVVPVRPQPTGQRGRQEQRARSIIQVR